MLNFGWVILIGKGGFGPSFFCPYFSHMMTVEITGTPDLDSIITVAQLKEHLRVDHTDEDTLIEAYRDAAIAWV